MGWRTGARAAYEAVEPATDLILPLLARSVYEHYSIINIFNPDTSLPRNEVDLRIYNNQDGEVLAMVTAVIRAGDSTLYDTNWDQRLFGPGVVGTNAPMGGWLGSVRLTAQKPVVVLAYGDEAAGDVSMAYVARPVSSADPTQYRIFSIFRGSHSCAQGSPSLRSGVRSRMRSASAGIWWAPETRSWIYW